MGKKPKYIPETREDRIKIVNKRQWENPESYKLIPESRPKYKHDIELIKKVAKLCAETSDLMEIYTKVGFEMSVSHIKKINYILKYGNPSTISLLIEEDPDHPGKQLYMISRIKLKIKNVDRILRDEGLPRFNKIANTLKYLNI